MTKKMSTGSHVQQFHSPRTVIMRFVARRTIRSATFVALAFGAFVASKVVGYVDVYPTAHDRLVAASLYVNNIGLIALFGIPRHIETVSGFAVWYTLAIGVLLGGIWAYLVATKTFRGEETAGRWELFLAGQTTASRAAANALAGLGISLVVFYAISAVTLVTVGRVHNVDFAAGPALFLALAATSGAAIFMAIGAFASQLMPTRARATGLATGIFGLCYLARAAGDITNAHWLLNITPFGWIEQLQPLFNPQPLWLLPIAGLVAALVAATIFLAGHRDLGASLFADHDTAKPRLLLLRGPLTAAIRLTRASSLSWLAAMTAFMLFFGALTNTAAKAFSSSQAAQNLLDRLVRVSQEAGAKAFLGIGFMIFIVVLMAYVASAVGAMREDEAQDSLDNFLVRPVSRLRWLGSRVVLIVTVIVAATLCASVVAWLGMAANHNGISFNTLLLASLNAIAPAVFTLGVGLLALGLVPRLTTVFSYGVIAWSFLIEMVSSGLNLSHWILDTSILYHVTLAPAVDPDWQANAILVAIGIVLSVIGAVCFSRRDLEAE